MNDGPKHLRAQPMFDLRRVTELSSTEAEADGRIRDEVAGSRLLLQDLELQAEGLQGPDRTGQDVLFGLLRSVHNYPLSTPRGHVSIVDKARAKLEESHCPGTASTIETTPMSLQIRTAAWAQVLSHFGTPTRPKDYQEPMWLGSARYWHRMAIWVPPDWTYLAICTKRSSVDWWSDGGRVPRDIAVVHARLSE